jgi:hypothetical protein
MEKRLPFSRIQKTTSKIAFLGLAAATMMVTVSIIGAVIQLQEASAVKPSIYCYTDITGFMHCYGDKKLCRDDQRSDPGATSRCRHFA